MKQRTTALLLAAALVLSLLATAALAAEGAADIDGFEAVSVSWPSFWSDMQGLEVK